MVKQTVFNQVESLLKQQGFRIVQTDKSRPWGGFFVIDEKQAGAFASHYFPGENFISEHSPVKLSPKILIVAPHQRLSWQYHHRRAEIWKCIGPDVGVVLSDTDEEKEQYILHSNEVIRLEQGIRHRLVGLDDWGQVAEIWQHTHPSLPSDEEDIVRLQDDYHRK